MSTKTSWHFTKRHVQKNTMKKGQRVKKSDIGTHQACNAQIKSNRTVTDEDLDPEKTVTCPRSQIYLLKWYKI